MCKYDDILALLRAGAKADFETESGYTALIMSAGALLLCSVFALVTNHFIGCISLFVLMP